MDVIDDLGQRTPTNYASFWDRFGAFLIDILLLGAAQFAIGFAIGYDFTDPNADPDKSNTLNVISFLIGFFYYAGMESSKNQATLGKMALGIKVTDLNGNRISFANALGRYLARILSSIILLIGYLMQPFTAKKQALHDMLAGTLVIKGEQ
jgi:uncharacterized RDD family membrane protein YckC